ncbi:GH3 auxin-responsive promoter [Corchorus olitorius]|uniref:GH3 auxin-responsive promoter n=1 Tax=Corchorus olitorius TaxID=93759 RepID=A0A1R3HSY8_9ROSI|nr:GH3 auxin-responsive promoter [Corchorus olitorius]
MAGLVNMKAKDYEDGLKILEDITSNAHEIQEKVLEDILRRNSGTEYLKGFLNGQIDKQLFKKNVPIVTYEDIKPYMDRIANGEPSNILLAEPITGFFRSGTSGGQAKLIPSTAEFILEKFALFLTMTASVVKKHVHGFEHGKRIYFMFGKPEIETPSGLMARSVSTSYFKSINFAKTVSENHTNPIETVLCPDSKQSMFCQLLAGLIHRDEVVSIGSFSLSAVVRTIKFLEDHWKELCFNIETGHVSDWINDSGCRTAMSLILKPDPKLANSLEMICCSKSWEGIIQKLWPKTKFIDAIATGGMGQYVTALNFYSGGLPIVSPFYASSEALFGINLEPLNKPSDVSYTFLPNMAYFEFIPVEKDDGEEVQFNGVSDQEHPIETKHKDEDTEPVDLVNVTPGQYYEVVVTTSSGLYRYRVGDILMATGFHNNSPQFQFVERKNVILSIDADKTSESDLIKAVEEAKALLDPVDLLLIGFSSYADTSSIPGHYAVFWELKTKQGDDVKELDPEIMVQCCSIMEESLSYIYKVYRKENAIAALEIRVVKNGSFDALMDYFVSQGASMNQYKAPSCIKTKEAVEILNSRVTGRFFSQKTF